MTRLLIRISVVALLGVVVLVGVASFSWSYQQPNMTWGVSFDPYHAEEMFDLDPQETLRAIVTDLGADHVRLTAHWDQLEIAPNQYDWSTLDWQIDAAEQYGADVVLTIGRKLPRWPECYAPAWTEQLSANQQRQALLEHIETVVRRYQDRAHISMWQVENEPFVSWFGECPPPDKQELNQEVSLVKQLDDRPILITDSGELSTWIPAAKRADVFGTTLYRVVWNKTVGFFSWPLPPAYYYFKGTLARWLTGVEQIITSEVQAEPWSPTGDITNLSAADMDQSMSVAQLEENIQYVRDAGFSAAYLWGAEWWYWMKTTQGDDRYWQTAQQLWP